MSRAFIVETVTGDVLDEVEPDYSWSAALNEAETIKYTAEVEDPDEYERDWRNLATSWKHSIIIEEGGRLMGGPIIPHTYEPGGPLEFTSRGMRHMMARRRVLPRRAYEQGTIVLPDGRPDPACDTVLEGLDLGSIGRALIEQAMLCPGGALPISLHAPRAGTRTKTYRGSEMKKIDEALAQLSDVIGGPDFDFRPYWEVETRKVAWRFVSGTEERPRLASSSEHVWEVSADWSPMSDIGVETDPTAMGSASWALAGRGDDSVLCGYSWDVSLIDAGFPLMDIVDTSHGNVTEQDTLDGYAAAGTMRGREIPEFWDFSALATESPRLAEYWTGDFCRLNVDHGAYIPAQSVRRRILALSGAAGSDWVKITTGRDYEGE